MEKKYTQFKKHKCGYTETGDIDWWIKFHTICPQCSEIIEYFEVIKKDDESPSQRSIKSTNIK